MIVKGLLMLGLLLHSSSTLPAEATSLNQTQSLWVGLVLGANLEIPFLCLPRVK